MRTTPRSWARRIRRGTAVGWLGLGILLAGSGGAHAITLTGANGREVEFAGLKDATPQGITAKVEPEADLIGVRWERLDLEALRREHPSIYRSYERATEGETISLDLGIFAPEDQSMEKDDSGNGGTSPKPKKRDRYPEWEDVQVGGTTFLMQLPAGTVEGILLISQGENGRSFRYLRRHEPGGGFWGEFQNDHRFALMAYTYGDVDDDYDRRKMDEFAFVEKGSGDDVLAAVDRIAKRTGRAKLEEVPFALYGTGRQGACFAYHFALWKPERIVAAVACKGAFYRAEPDEAAAKVPLLFVWGEYSNDPELWNSDRTAKAVLAEYASLTPNWTAGREYRGGGELNLVVEHFGREYLHEMIERRIPEEPPETEDEGKGEGEGEDGEDDDEGGDSDGGKEGAEEEAETKGDDEGDDASEKSDEKSDAPALVPVERAEGYVGDLETGETSAIGDPSAPLGENETFLPNRDVASLWSKLVQGQLRPPERE